MDINYSRIILMILTTFVFSSIIMIVMRKLAYHMGIIDDTKEERRIHKIPTPRIGGVGIFLTFLFGYIFFAEPEKEMISILIGSFLLIFVGFVDDVRPFKSNKIKLYVEIIASLIVIFYGGILLDNVDAFGIYLEFGIFAYPLTIIWLVGMMNAINMIDGMDGVSGGITSIFFLTIGITAIILGGVNSLEITLSFIMLGSTMGFLLHNFHPAKIFVGDSGSMFLGFIIGVISLLGFKNVTITSLIVPILIMGVPILDTAFALIRRALKKEPLNKPDKEHFHYQLLNMGFGYKPTVLIIYLINILFALASIVYVLEDPSLGKIIYIILLILVVWFVMTTNIITEKKLFKKKKRTK